MLTMRILAIAILLVTLPVVATAIGAAPYSAHMVPAMSAPSCNRVSTVAITPTSPKNMSDLNIQVGANLNFNVSIANSCPINSFFVFILFNSTVLKTSAASLDYSSNVLGSQAQVGHECVENLLVQGSCDPDSDRADTLSLELYLLGNQSTPDPTNGLLFKLSFSVIAKGTSQLHLFNVLTNNGAASVSTGGKKFLVYPDTTDGDAFFTNALCSTKICQAPIVTVSPQQTALYTKRQGTFNSNGTNSRNPGGHIRSKYWDFGQGESKFTDNRTVLAYVYLSPGNYTLTLSATDSYGVTASRSIQVSVGEIWIEVSIGDVRVTPYIGVYAGTVIHIVSNIFNNSVFPENSTLTISMEGNVLNNFTFYNLPSHGGQSLTATWNTTGLATRIYRVDSIATPPPNANSTRNSIRSSYVQLIDPLPQGIRLSLAQTAGVSILVVGLVVFIATRLRKRPAWETEPL